MASSNQGRSSSRGSAAGFDFDYLNYDTTLTKVFVGGLAWETQTHTLHSFFQHFGDILEAVVIYDKHTGRSKGYGFVTFRDPESAKRACVDPTPIIDGRRANCNLAALGRPPPTALLIGEKAIFCAVFFDHKDIIDHHHLTMELCLFVERILGVLVTNSHNTMAFSKDTRIHSMVMRLMVPSMSIHRVFTILMLISSTFKYMGYLEQLIQLCILTMLVKMFPVAMVIHHCGVMHCLVIKLCNLVDPLSIQSQHHLFKQFKLHILQVWFHLFQHHHS